MRITFDTRVRRFKIAAVVGGTRLCVVRYERGHTDTTATSSGALSSEQLLYVDVTTYRFLGHTSAVSHASVESGSDQHDLVWRRAFSVEYVAFTVFIDDVFAHVHIQHSVITAQNLLFQQILPTLILSYP